MTITAPRDFDSLEEEPAPSRARSQERQQVAETAVTSTAAGSGTRVVSGSVLAPPPREEPATVEARQKEPPRPPADPATIQPVPPEPSLPLPPPSFAGPVDPPRVEDSEPEVIVTEEEIAPPEIDSLQPSPLLPPPVDEVPASEEVASTAPALSPDPPAPTEPAERLPVPKTEPIRVNARRDDALPPLPTTGSADLPRLDVTLGEGGIAPAPSLAEPSAPTRVRLPQLGETHDARSPEEFVVPSDPASPVGDELEAGMTEPIANEAESMVPPSLQEFSIPQADPEVGPAEELDEAVEPGSEFDPIPLDSLDEAVGDPAETAFDPGFPGTEAFPTAPVTEAVAPDPLPLEPPPSLLDPAPTAPAAVEETAPVAPFDSGSFAEAEPPHEPQADYGEGVLSLHEGSFENLLSHQLGAGSPDEPAAEPPTEAPIRPRSSVVSPQFPFGDTGADVAESAPGVPQDFASDPGVAQELASDPGAIGPFAGSVASTEHDPELTEAEVLDEMFGTSSPRRMKRSTIVILSVIAAVAVIATISMIVVINALGGLNPTYADLAQKSVPPPPIGAVEEIAPISPGSGSPTTSEAPGIDGAPAVIDPGSSDPVQPNPSGSTPVETVPEAPVEETPGGAPPVIEPGATSPQSQPAPTEPGDSTAAPDGGVPSEIGREDPNLSFQERLDRAVERVNQGGTGESLGIDPSMSTDLTDPGTTPGLVGAASAAAAAAGLSEGAENYNPPAAFRAPEDTEGSPLGKTHDLLDAFLRAPTWESRVPYIFQGDSLRAAMEEYYRKWPFERFERFSLQLYQMEQDPEMGGPYWVYLVSESDTDQGFPVIIRVEDGNLKVDWEIFSEFRDRHFTKFLAGEMPSPNTFRLVIERVSDYYGPDRDEFTDLEDYVVYQVYPPYGDMGEFTETAFVKIGTELATSLDEVVGLTDEALAVIIKIENRTFAHGAKHLVVTEYLTEGWFR